VLDVDRAGNVIISVHVQPGARRSEVVGGHGDALKLRVAAPPEDGKANRAVVALVAETLGVAPGAVELVSGASSRRKRLRVSGRTEADVRARLAPWTTTT
jgi:uncharacterized protein (TIGR00251 family)